MVRTLASQQDGPGFKSHWGSSLMFSLCLRGFLAGTLVSPHHENMHEAPRSWSPGTRVNLHPLHLNAEYQFHHVAHGMICDQIKILVLQLGIKNLVL